MEEQRLVLLESAPSGAISRITARDAAAAVFRHRRLAGFSFLLVLVLALAVLLLMPKYQSQMRILVNRERLDPQVTPDNSIRQLSGREAVTEQDINSEVELLRGNDLLAHVAVACGLAQRADGSRKSGLKLEKAVQSLGSGLRIEPLRKSNIISVKYRASNPDVAAKVLSTLADLYVQKHLEVHRPAGELEFFDQQAERYGKELAATEERLARFPRDTGVVAGRQQEENTLQKLAELQLAQQQATAAVIEGQRKMRDLQNQLAKTPQRVTTEVRSLDNPQLMQQLKTTLLNLQLKHTELLQRYAPTYRPVREVEQQMAKTETAIAEAEKAPLRDRTTDRDKTHEWLRSEWAKTRADTQAMEGRAAAISSSIAEYRRNATELNEKAIEQQDLLRTAKAQEDNYLLYVHKREEARIADALDRRRILNVRIVDPPRAPVLPVHSPAAYVMAALVLALVFSSAMVVVSEYMSSSFRSPDEVQRYLAIPVIAALPDRRALMERGGLTAKNGGAPEERK